MGDHCCYCWSLTLVVFAAHLEMVVGAYPFRLYPVVIWPYWVHFHQLFLHFADGFVFVAPLLACCFSCILSVCCCRWAFGGDCCCCCCSRFCNWWCLCLSIGPRHQPLPTDLKITHLRFFIFFIFEECVWVFLVFGWGTPVCVPGILMPRS